MTTTKNNTTTDTTGMAYLDLPISELADHPANLRFDLGNNVSDLAASIAENGLIAPIIVAPLPSDSETGSGYLVIAGHRRIAACRQLGWVTVPAISRPDLASPDGTAKADHLFLMLDENTQREGLTTQEVSAGLTQLAAFPGLTPAKVAKRTGRDVEAVKHAVAAAKLPEDVRPLVVADALTLDQANQAAYDALIVKDTATRLHRHTVAYMALSIEDDTRRVNPTRRDSWGGPRTARWLQRLADLGYELGDAEQIVTTTWPAE